MEYKIIDKKTGNIIYHAGYYTATTALTKILWDRYITELKGYTKKYQFNYSNKQTIEFTIDNYIHRFENIPTKLGTLDNNALNNEIIKIIKGGIEK